jgi:hypothetical protein
MSDTQRLTVVSGGQSGVDRAGLDAAIALGLEYRGWCPRGGWAEDFPEPPGLLALYPRLRETPDDDPRQRSARNVRDADAVLVLIDASGIMVSGGTLFAADCAAQSGKPRLIVDLDEPEAERRVSDWLAHLARPCALCIGGPRESEAAGIYGKTLTLLRAALSREARRVPS